MKLKITCESYELQYDEWIDSVKLTVDVIRDCFMDQRININLTEAYTVSAYADESITILHFPSIDSIPFRDTLIHRLTCYSHIRIIDIYMDHFHKDGHDDHIVYFEDFIEESESVEVIEKLPVMLEMDEFEWFGIGSIQHHIQCYNMNKDLYLSMKLNLTNTILVRMGDNINDNDISDCLLLNIMPNIVYNKAEDQMYSYTDSQGWSPYTRENLMYSISFTSRNFDPLIHTYMGSYQIRNLLCSDIIMKIRNVCIVDSLTMKNAIGMKNGIYNVDKHIFEPFNQRYLLNTSTNIFYSDDHSIVLNDILSTIFPSPEIRAFVFRWFGYTIEFGNPEKFLTIWHGPSGNNGKSWLQRLFRETMGDYCCNVPVSLLTSKRQASNAASPDISMLENKLITFLQEPETSERIHGGRAKELTGNDSVYTRNLYKSPRNIDIWAKLVIVSNNHLETIGLDAAMKRRILVIPFESTFVTEIEMEDRINRKASTKHYYIRKNIDKLCSSLAPAFMRLIVDQHRKYTEDGIFLSSLILDYTVEFILSTNRTLKFIRKYLSHLPGTSMSSEILYEQFKVWHKQWYPAKVIPNMEVFIDELIRECYEMKDGSYIEDVYSSYELA